MAEYVSARYYHKLLNIKYLSGRGVRCLQIGSQPARYNDAPSADCERIFGRRDSYPIGGHCRGLGASGRGEGAMRETGVGWNDAGTPSPKRDGIEQAETGWDSNPEKIFF